MSLEQWKTGQGPLLGRFVEYLEAGGDTEDREEQEWVEQFSEWLRDSCYGEINLL